MSGRDCASCSLLNAISNGLIVCLVASVLNNPTTQLSVTDTFNNYYSVTSLPNQFNNLDYFNAVYTVSPKNGTDFIIFTFPAKTYSITASCFDIYDPGYNNQAPYVTNNLGSGSAISINGFFSGFDAPVMAMFMAYNSAATFKPGSGFTIGYSPTVEYWSSGSDGAYVGTEYGIITSQGENCPASLSPSSDSWYEMCVEFAP